MKRFSSYCSSSDCPFKDCERHKSKNINEEDAYNFEGTCQEYHKYFMDKLNGKDIADDK